MCYMINAKGWVSIIGGAGWVRSQKIDPWTSLTLTRPAANAKTDDSALICAPYGTRCNCA